MGYGLLWIESLIFWLLWTAVLSACAVRVQRRRNRWFLWGAAVVLPLLILGGVTAAAAYLKFAAGFEANRFWYAATLFAAYLIGAVAILFKALRKPEPALSRAAFSWPRGRLAAALLTVAALSLMTTWNLDLEVRGRAAALKVEAGTLLLTVSPPTVSDSQNAALIYEKAFERLEADKVLNPQRPPVNSPLFSDLTDFNDPALRAMLARHERTVALLRQGAALPDCRFDHDYAHPSITMLLPELNRVRAASNLLRLHARYQISQGHVESAIADISTIFRLARDLGGEPLVLITDLVAVGIDSMAVNLLQEALPAIARKEQLATLNLGDPDSLRRILRRSLDGEEAFGLSIFSDIVSGQLGLAAMQGTGTPERRQEWSDNSDFVTGTFFGLFFLSEDLNAYRRVMDQFRAAAAMPYFQGREAASAAEKSLLPPRRTPLTSIIAPAISTALRSSATAQAAHAAAVVAVAMTRFRIDRGSYPSKLEELVPTYLEEIPADPFDGKPLRLISKDGQWIVYSIGPDGKDDGGAPYDFTKHTGDIVFTLKSPVASPSTHL
jgi:hypothetical protein